MPEPTNALPTENIEMIFTVPADRVDEAKRIMRDHGFEQAPETVPWRKALGDDNINLSSANLAAARFKEGLTQMQLSEKTGIPRRHISEMENGRRGIGKQNARKLGAALNIDPRLLVDI